MTTGPGWVPGAGVGGGGEVTTPALPNGPPTSNVRSDPWRRSYVVAMIYAALVLAALAAALHVYIWWLESIAWTTPAARKVFRTSPAEAEATKFLAYNQGYYNLFLALMVVAGIIAYAVGQVIVGLTLVMAGVGAMALAAVVLASASAAHRQAAMRQGLFPVLALVAAAVHLAL